MFPIISNLKVTLRWAQQCSFMDFQCLYVVKETWYMLLNVCLIGPKQCGFLSFLNFFCFFFGVIIWYPNVFPCPLNGFSAYAVYCLHMILNLWISSIFYVFFFFCMLKRYPHNNAITRYWTFNVARNVFSEARKYCVSVLISL